MNKKSGLKAKIAVGCLLLTVFPVIGIWFWPGKATISSKQYQRVLDEIMGVEFVFRNPTPDNGGTSLAYVHGAEQGRGLYILDLKTMQRTTIPLSNEVSHVSGWSPDDRYLAFLQTPSEEQRKGTGVDQSWMTVWDRHDNSVRRLTADDGVVESYFCWLTTNTYVYSRKWLTNDYAEFFMGSLEGNEAKKVSNYRPELIGMSETTAAHLERDGNIVSLLIKPLAETDTGTNHESRKIKKLSNFKKGQFDQIRWLRYSRETGKFLFCARPKKSPWRYVFEFNPKGRVRTQLNKEDTYNGQFLQNGRGFAYVGNSNNNFFLAVRPENPSEHTNLFTQGSVVNYTATPDGNRIYVTASQGVEPQGLWEYDVEKRSLRRVVSGISTEFVNARIIEPEERKVKSFDEVEVPCFFFKPVIAASQGSKVPGNKYPAVIFLSPRSGQFQRSFDARSQLLANLGFHFVAVNYRGCDGYGRNYAALANPENAAKDILAVYEELIKDPTVDPGRVFLSSSSDGSSVAEQVLKLAPGMWRGVTMENPIPIQFGSFSPDKLPPIFFATGDLDSAAASLQGFQNWGKEKDVQISSVVYTNSGHITYKASQRKDKLDRVARFMMDKL